MTVEEEIVLPVKRFKITMYLDANIKTNNRGEQRSIIKSWLKEWLEKSEGGIDWDHFSIECEGIVDE